MTGEGEKIFGGGRMENIARIAKAALHKLPGNSNANACPSWIWVKLDTDLTVDFIPFNYENI